jgi:type III pantothenate kinase
MTRLLVDIGNSRVKWALERHGVLEQTGSAMHRDRPVDEALRPLQRLDAKLEQTIVSNVAGEVIAEALDVLVRRRFGVVPEFVAVQREAFGLRIAYAHPERLGVDRWLGMLGARAARPGVLLVVGAGTAVTADAVDEQGIHLGGIIVPGIATMKASLLAETAGIRDAGEDPARAPELFADDTGAGVNGGVAHALAALVDRAAAELERRTGAAPTLVLTGGDAARIEPLIHASTTVEPDLVLRGLVVYARGR